MVLPEAQACQEPPGGEIGFKHAGEHCLCSALFEKPTDQGSRGLPAQATTMVCGMENIPEAPAVGGYFARRRWFCRVPRPAVTNHLARFAEFNGPAEIEPIRSGRFSSIDQLKESGEVLLGTQWSVGQVLRGNGIAAEPKDRRRIFDFQRTQDQAFRADWSRKGHSGPGSVQLKALRRPSKARPRVTSSAYSRSPPTGSPDASRVTAMPIDLSMRAR